MVGWSTGTRLVVVDVADRAPRTQRRCGMVDGPAVGWLPSDAPATGLRERQAVSLRERDNQPADAGTMWGGGVGRV